MLADTCYFRAPPNNSAVETPTKVQIFRPSKFREDFSSEKILPPPTWVYQTSTQASSLGTQVISTAMSQPSQRSSIRSGRAAMEKSREEANDDAFIAAVEKRVSKDESSLPRLVKRVVKKCIPSACLKTTLSPSQETLVEGGEKPEPGSREADDAIIAEAEKVKVPWYQRYQREERAPGPVIEVPDMTPAARRSAMKALEREREGKREWLGGLGPSR